MKKGLVIFVFIVFVTAGLVGGGYVYLVNTSKPVIRETLSERSKEFIANQRKADGGSWDNVTLGKKRPGEHDFDSNRVTVDGCYSVIIPFQVVDSRKNDPCVYYAILSSPRGSVTTNLRKVGFQKTDEAPDVTFRRAKKEQYKESSVTVKNNRYLIFTDVTTGTEKTAFGMQETAVEDGSGKLFTITFSLNASDEVQVRQMKKILESLRLE